MTGPGIAVRLATMHDLAEITDLVARNAEFLAPWEPLRQSDWTTDVRQQQVIMDALARHAAGTAMPLVITQGDVIVGRININDIVRGAFQSGHLGYWVSQDHVGRGVATAAVAATVELAFGELRLHRLQAGTLLHNLGSQQVLRRNGFTEIGVAPSYLKIADRWQDHLLFQRVVGAEPTAAVR